MRKKYDEQKSTKKYFSETSKKVILGDEKKHYVLKILTKPVRKCGLVPLYIVGVGGVQILST